MDRTDVYAAIVAECEFQYADRKAVYVTDCNRHVSEYLSLLGYLGTELWIACRCIYPLTATDIFRQIAAVCVTAMESHGCCSRDVNSGRPGEWQDGPLRRSVVFRIIDTEREYKIELGDDRIDGLHGFICMYQSYMGKAIEQWTNNVGDEYALDVIRKLAGVAVHAMERHGVNLREPYSE